MKGSTLAPRAPLRSPSPPGDDGGRSEALPSWEGRALRASPPRRERLENRERTPGEAPEAARAAAERSVSLHGSVAEGDAQVPHASLLARSRLLRAAAPAARHRPETVERDVQGGCLRGAVVSSSSPSAAASSRGAGRASSGRFARGRRSRASSRMGVDSRANRPSLQFTPGTLASVPGRFLAGHASPIPMRAAMVRPAATRARSHRRRTAASAKRAPDSGLAHPRAAADDRDEGRAAAISPP